MEIENKKNAIDTVIAGAYRNAPLKDSISAEPVFRERVIITANAPRFIAAYIAR